MTMKKNTWKDIKLILEDMKAPELRKILQDLYKFNGDNKSFFHSRFSNHLSGGDYLEPYKKRIRQAICPEKPWRKDFQLSVGKKAISEFKQANGNIEDLLTLMLLYVSSGNDFTLEYGDINETFYSSMASMYASIIELLIKHQDESLVSKFKPQLKTELIRVKSMGWGYPDELEESLESLDEAFSKIIQTHK